MWITTAGIISIAIGLLCFGASYYSVMTKKATSRAWAFGIVGFVCLTIIPVTLAVFFAATTT